MFLNESTVLAWFQSNATVVPTVYVSSSPLAHRILENLPTKELNRLDLIAGHRLDYDVPLLPTVRPLTAEQFVHGPSDRTDFYTRRFAVNVQENCELDDFRFLDFVSKFVAIDVFGGCAPKVTWNSKYARDREKSWYFGEKKLSNTVRFSDYAVAIISDAGAVGSNGGVNTAVWEALADGAVPVYWGHKNMHEWLPDRQSAIDVSQLPSPVHLVAILQKLREDRSKLQVYHTWRARPPSCLAFGHQSLFCRAIKSQVPRSLSWNATVSLIKARLQKSSFKLGRRFLGLMRENSSDILGPQTNCRQWLPLSSSAPLSETDEIGLRVSGNHNGDATSHPATGELHVSSKDGAFTLRIQKRSPPTEDDTCREGASMDELSCFQLIPETPNVASQLEDMSSLLRDRLLFEGRRVLHLGFHSLEVLPFAGLIAWLHGGAASVTFYGPRRDLPALSSLFRYLGSWLPQGLVPLTAAILEDFRQPLNPRSFRNALENTSAPPARCLWLEAGANEFLQADVVLALGGSLRQLTECTGFNSMEPAIGLLRHLSREALIVGWFEVSDGILELLHANFMTVGVVAQNEVDGVVFLCLGPRAETGAWSQVKIDDAYVPVFSASSEPDSPPLIEEIARSGFTWNGTSVTKTIYANAGEVVKVTSTYLALKESFFLYLFAPDFMCTPALHGSDHGIDEQQRDVNTNLNRGDTSWSMMRSQRIYGPDLDMYLSIERSPLELRNLMRAVLDLLFCLGSHGVQHNDLWGPNIIVENADNTKEGNFRLVAIDFGAASLKMPGGWDENGLVDEIDGWVHLAPKPIQERARKFLEKNRINFGDFPQFVSNFVLETGEPPLTIEPTSDRRMVGALLAHKLAEYPTSVSRFRHVIEVLAMRDSEAGIWSLNSIRFLLEELAV